MKPRSCCTFRLLTAMIVALLLCILPSAECFAQGGTVEVKSKKLTIDSKTKEAVFEGAVKAQYGDITLSCEKMRVTYSADGAVATMVATGGVRVSRGGAVATAQAAKLDAASQVIVLTGSPRLKKGPHTLEGKKVVVHLASGRMDVTEAVGVFEIGKAAKQ